MVRIMKCTSFMLNKSVVKISQRNISKYLDKDITSKAIRQRFLDYFIKDLSHDFVRSSPVIPYCDPSVAFVNAGMNQFKGVFLGTQIPQYRKVANSQKCIRVGGKHNDLNAVGLDSYHHTFFEMLGNWSFGDYFKKEACEMAWNLLTDKYKINKEVLYVTYFGGDNVLGLEPDLECKDIWRSIGIKEERILPFGANENFWEMGSTGPCGPCTEIHVDLLGLTNRSLFVNKGLPDLPELWNIVCIQYNRNSDGSIEPLPQNHIDTGMGFERLTTVLQGKVSNYDTDIFTYIFDAIQKISKNVPPYGGKFGELDWNELDTNYRILADHARMMVTCLGDGVIPEQNQKLRRIMRRIFLISETVFKKDKGLPKELSNYIVENLGPVYSELETNIKQIHQIIDYEEEVYKLLRKQSSSEWEKLLAEQPKLSNLDAIEMPGLIAALKEIKSLSENVITPNFAFKLYDTHGLDENTIVKVADVLDFKLDVDGFRKELNNAKIRSRRQGILSESNIYEDLVNGKVKLTDDNYKYEYSKLGGKYNFKNVEAELLQVICNGVAVESIKPDVECSVVLDKSNFYTESGGQVSDKGLIKFGDGIFHVQDTANLNGYVLHLGVLNGKNTVDVSTPCNLEIDQAHRLSIMKNHTTTHLLNSVLKLVKQATCQKSSKVTSKFLNLDVGIFGAKLTIEEIKKIDNQICNIINSGVEVKCSNIDSQQLLNTTNVTLIPGEYYPNQGIRLIEILGPGEFQSKEPCCGTHVSNTSDIEDFCIIGFKSLGRSTTSLHAVTGDRAKLAKINGSNMLDSIFALQKSIQDNIDKPEVLKMAVATLRQNLKYEMDSESILPVVVKHECSELLNKISKQVKNITKEVLNDFVEMEMQNVLESNKSEMENNKRYIVHYLACSAMLDTVPLQKATKMCQDIPVIVISYSDSTVKARCCVPKDFKTKDFDAEKWLSNTISSIFESSPQFNKGQDLSLVCNMNSKKINIKDWDTLLKQSLDAANNYAQKYLN